MSGLCLALASIASAHYWPDLLHERVAAASEAWKIAEDLSLPFGMGTCSRSLFLT